MRESKFYLTPCFFKLIAEVQRHFSLRYDDILVLRSLSDNKLQRLKVQSGMADRSIKEILARDEWRTIREEALLLQLNEGVFDGAVKKK